MKKFTCLILTLILLSGCAESLALLGPVSGSGNMAQSALSSSLSYSIKKQTGKSPAEHAIAYVKKHNPENKKDKCVEFIDAINSKACVAIKENIKEKRKKLVKIKTSIFDKYKIENLAKDSDLLSR
jgi:hypothetical protein